MRLILTAALLAATTLSSAAQFNESDRRKVETAAQKVLAETGVPSASIGIMMNGKTVYTGAFGLATISPEKVAEPTMAYPIGSVSKQFTATAVLLLQQQGKLSIDDPVSKYFPTLTRAKDVKLRNLMSMTSGYEDFAPQDYSIPAWYQVRKPIDTIMEWATKPLDFEPGTEYQYSNTNYVLLALIVEKVTGEPFYTFLRHAVLDPAHLPEGQHGVFNAYIDREKLQVTGYVSYAMQPPRVLPLEANSWYFGDGELAMPPSVLLAWDTTFMQQSILSPESYKEMETPFVFTGGPNVGKPSTYALGLHIVIFNGHRGLEHSGEVGGYVAENLVFPDDKTAIVVLTNEVASEAATDIAKAVGDILMPAAANTAAGAGQDPTTAQLPAVLAGLAKGEIDRSLFTANCNSFFSADAMADYKAELAPLGAVASVTRVKTNQRGGMTFDLYRVVFTGGTALLMDSYTLPDGKIEQLLVLGKS
jgi:D-alanyl-D-alanine carboxypeptidase